jgi:hypothetical protein
MRKDGSWRRGLVRWLSLALFLGLPLPVARTAETPGKVVEETWDAAYLESGKAGFFHTTVREIDRDGVKVLRTTQRLDLTVKRNQTPARIRMETGNDETADGKVTGIAMRQFLSNDQTVLLTGVVEGTKLHLKTQDGRMDRTIPWNDEVIGQARQYHFFQEKKAKPGDQLSYVSFEPAIACVVTIHAAVKEEEEIEVLEVNKGKMAHVKKKLLRVEAQSDKITMENGSVQLPPLFLWLDKELLPVRSQTEIPGLGKITLYRTTREVATGNGDKGLAEADVLLTSLIPVNRALPRQAETRNAVYRVTVKDDDEPGTIFAQDERQQIKNLQGNTFEVHVQAIRNPQGTENSGEAREEFLESNTFLNCNDPKVKERVERAVGKETDLWKKAQLIETWVHGNMRLNNATPFTTAAQIARDLEGDCRQHAVLTAAMCRAAGIPSRTAVGLIYVNDRQRGPVMGFHMWTEVWVKGRWLALDAVWGLGSVGADHIKIADSSWHDAQSLTPLLPVTRVLGKVTIEVLRVNDRD